MTKHKPLNDAERSPVCKLLDRLAVPLEIVANLTFLALNDAEHPHNVRVYMQMAEEQMQVLRQIARETYAASYREVPGLRVDVAPSHSA